MFKRAMGRIVLILAITSALPLNAQTRKVLTLIADPVSDRVVVAQPKDEIIPELFPSDEGFILTLAAIVVGTTLGAWVLGSRH